MRALIRTKHYSIRTEQAYVDGVRRFILFHNKRHLAEMGKQELEAFLTHLAVERHVSASTQSQAKAALLFLYQKVLQQDLNWLKDVASAKQPQHMPTVLTVDEVRSPLGHPALPGIGNGNTFSQQAASRVILVPAPCVAIISKSN